MKKVATNQALIWLLVLSAVSVYAQKDYGIHDPCNIVKEGDRYYTFYTSNGVECAYSTDLCTWRRGGKVFQSGFPSWITQYVSGFGGHFWAPEVIFMNGKWHVYYSCSSFGSRKSAIGLATSVSLVNPKWEDQGMVVFSNDESNHNAIDADVMRTSDGKVYLAYGSFWRGIVMTELDSTSGMPIDRTKLTYVADGNPEAAGIIQHGKYYYLFFNRGKCCAGVNSTYQIFVGRSQNPTGPFLDKDNKATSNGGGTLVLSTQGRFIGPGHFGYFAEKGREYMSYHYYDKEQNGASKLKLATLSWENEWPVVNSDFDPCNTEYLKDCVGVVNGDAFIDECGECVGGTTGKEPCADSPEYSGNPLFKGIYTADPCAIVFNDTLYVFTGHDEQTESGKSFFMRDWYVFSTSNMVDWTNHGAKLKHQDFSWARGNAFAGHVTYNNGKFWWYVPLTHNSIKVGEGFSIGVAVADHPLGPWKDAIGAPIITDNTPNSVTLNIDPVVYVDDDGTPYMYWGSWGACRMVKLKKDMVTLDGAVQTVNAKGFFEAPWIHKKDNLYYLSYAVGYPSTTEYSTSTSITGPWTYRGVINDKLENSETNHQAIIEFKGNWYFIYHNAGLPGGGTYRRSVCIDKLEYNSDGTIKKVVRTSTGVPKVITSLVKPVVLKNVVPSQVNSIRKHFISNGGLMQDASQYYIFNLLGIRQNGVKKSQDGSNTQQLRLPPGMYTVKKK